MVPFILKLYTKIKSMCKIASQITLQEQLARDENKILNAEFKINFQ